MQTLTLSGWTQPADALLAIVPGALSFDYSDYPDASTAIAALVKFKETPRIIAWSLGGQLVLRAIAAGVLAPKQLLLIAPPFQFKNTGDFRDGMSAITYDQFRENYAKDTVRTVDRFHALVAKGHTDPRAIMKQLRHHPDVLNTARWLPWLDALGLDTLRGLSVPEIAQVTLIHGENDAIVPVAQSNHIRALLPNARYERWANNGHAPHLQEPEKFASLLAGVI